MTRTQADSSITFDIFAAQDLHFLDNEIRFYGLVPVLGIGAPLSLLAPYVSPDVKHCTAPTYKTPFKERSPIRQG